MTPDDLYHLAQVEQPAPVPNGESCHEIAISRVSSPLTKALIRGRQAIGLQRYGQPLTANNGRSAFTDLVQELGDALPYAVQYEIETGQDIFELIHLIDMIVVALAAVESRRASPQTADRTSCSGRP